VSFTRIAFRNIPRRKLRNALTLVAIMLGVMLLVGVNVAADSAVNEFHDYINEIWGETDIVVKYANAQPFAQENITLVRAVDGVANSAPRLSWQARIDNDTEKLVGIIGLNSTADFIYQGYNITGSAALSKTNVVASEGLSDEYNLPIDSSVNVTTTADGDPYWNRTYELKIFGVYHPPQGGEEAAYFLMDLEQVQNISGFPNMIDHIIVKVKDIQKTEAVITDLEKTLGPDFDVSSPKLDAIQQIQGMLQAFLFGIDVMITVSLVVCTFLVFNTMFMSVSERKYEIGVLRALGTSRRQIFWMFLSEGLILGLIGTLLGIPAGFVLSKVFLIIVQSFYQSPTATTAFIVTPNVIVWGLTAGLITVLFGTFYPALRACRVSVVEAIRPSMRVRGKAVPDIVLLIVGLGILAFGALQQLNLIPSIGIIDILSVLAGAIITVTVLFRKTVPLIDHSLSSMSPSLGKLVSRNMGRKMLRSAICFSIIGISLSFIVMMGGIESGIVIAMEQGVRDALGTDIILVSNQTIPTSFANNLTSMAEVEIATPMSLVWQGTKCFGAENRSVGIIVIDPKTFLDVTNYDFGSSTPEQVYRELGSNNESLMLPKSLADSLGVGVGQEISVFAMSPNEKMNFTVVGVFTSGVLQFINIQRPLSESIFISFNTQKTHFYGENTAILFLVNVKSQYKHETGQVLQKIETSYPKYGFEKNSLTLDGILSNARSQINRSFVIFFLILYFTVLITALGIAVTMIVNVTERRREIGILKSQGMSRSQVLAMFLTEALIIGIVGFIIGVPCGLLLLKGTTSTMSIMGLWFPFVMPWSNLVQAFMLAIAAAIVGALYPAYRASKANIVDALKAA